MHTKSKNNSWRKFFNFWMASPLRLGLLIIMVVAFILSGVLRVLLNDFIANVFEPLLIAALLFALLFYIVSPGRRK